MGSPGSALREELLSCRLCSVDSGQHQAPPCLLGASFDERWGVKDGVAIAGCNCMFPYR